ncbi:hypothetical protein HTV80_09620 [Streptomyces sp. Vc74B-19]|uniref:hypothetical protein n=1 Tax=unclassified Streptomyces TaxID=2593676 RepID=UPI001BFCA8B5|nr:MULTISPECIES: hypothetical protein [unclassified Streptomyces]MBT3163364.1 hypothetical protein [Streptomyces sp. Vc74B-19]MCO4694722.1 hypothetical protein [Streptomyces sp. RO-S4]MDU0301652.1 hypothetical protein [Streptomyces sp. PAL114]
MRQPSDSGAVTGEPEGPDPVFVDASGRRARLLRRAGYGAAGLAAGYLSVLALSLMGATPFAPEALLPPLPGESSPTAPLRQDAEGDARPPEDAGAGVGPGTPLIPLITGEDPAGSLLLPPGAGPGSVAGVPVQPPDAGGVEVTDGPAPPEEPDAEEPGAPEEPQEPGAGEPSAPGDGGDSEAPQPGTDEPSGPGTDNPPEPPGTPQPTPEAPSENPGASLPDDPPAAGTP